MSTPFKADCCVATSDDLTVHREDTGSFGFTLNVENPETTYVYLTRDDARRLFSWLGVELHRF